MPASLSTAIVHTLLHSFWEAAVAALLAALLLTGTRMRRSVYRYNLLLVLFGGLAAAVLITFLFESGGAAVEGPRLAIPGIGGITPFIDRRATLIAGAWIILFVGKIVYLSLDLYRIQRLKRLTTTAADEKWSARLAQLSAELHLTRNVRLLESAIVPIPLVIGHRKPVILVPAGLPAHLPPAEVEAILLHELAHIRRGDYLVNGFLQIFQSLLFFNPAVWWLGHLLRTEREHCCDDSVVQLTGSKATYVRALIRFSEQNPDVPAFAHSFPGAKNATLARIERLAAGRNRSLNKLEGLALMVMIGVSVWLIPTGQLLHPAESPGMTAKKKAEAAAMLLRRQK